VAPVEDPVVEVRLPLAELGRLHGIVQHHGVEQDVRRVIEQSQAHRVQRREVPAAVSAVAHLPATRLALVQDAVEHAREGRALAHALAFGEGVAQDEDPPHTRALGLERSVAKTRCIPAAFHPEGRSLCQPVEATKAQALVAQTRFGIAQIDVQLATRVLRVEVQDHLPLAHQGRP
jgi:hypothetical protein